ncbi:hypothetical protein SELMODRAFT_229898 [Selaginella moellendorffii]|uniref:Uncharacterized protein n=1 Tax=Selaginella moellendorffii TaxID=88036 RepID=D8QQX3_SELML|nr:hypothetical protein SELMODRAFT_229898 [Selaginella moellendorffii]
MIPDRPFRRQTHGVAQAPACVLAVLSRHPEDTPPKLQLEKKSSGEHVNVKSGDYGSFIGRNAFAPASGSEELLDPHPSVVATKFLSRKESEFADTGKQFNMIAASWIQFMIHDWVDHQEDTKEQEIVAPESVAAQCPLKEFRFLRTKEDETGSQDIPLGHRNMRTSWWDGSVLYGSHDGALARVRTGKDGKLKIGQNGLLERDDHGVAISGDVKNTWAGVSILQALFVKEHNAVCDMLKRTHPEFGDEELYLHARLVVAAVIAKIHTIDWTVELLKTKALDIGMHANWYGLLGKRIKSWIGHTGSSLLSGFIGMKEPINHGVPYALTEEFTCVYRLHPLLPDDIVLRDITGKRMIASLGHQACGALVLFNYPQWMRDLPQTGTDGINRPNHVDMAALEIYRDRERKVARYNAFRRNMLMIPIKKWEDLTDDKQTLALLREVYGEDVEKLDLLVGLLAEKKIKGFAISETSFFIFLLMATRRLEADRFFTSNFNAKSYTKEGLAWVNNTESLKDVLQRHHGNLVDKWLNARSAFSVWSA